MHSGMIDLSDYIRVTNNTDKDIKGRFDGKEYLFKKGLPTDVHVNAAEHIFDFGRNDKTRAFHRLGWLDGNKTYEDAEALLLQVTFEDVPSPTLDIAPGKKPGRKRTSSPIPLADGGADEGEDSSSPDSATGTDGDL